MKKIRLIVPVLAMTLGMGISAYAGQWQSDANGWWWQEDDGSYPTNTWKWIDGNNDGVAEFYYFDGNGYMLSNGTAPNGSQVDADGKWIVSGVVQTQNVLPEHEPQLTTVTSIPTTIIGEGTYKVGSEIGAGEYVLLANSSIDGYYERNSDSSGDFDSIIQNGLFSYNTIITVNNGEYLTLNRCTLSPMSEITQIDYTKGDMFKVGYHIPAGEYKLQSNSDVDAYYAVYNSSDSKDIVTNDLFKGQTYITVKDGQYLDIDRCNIVSVQ